MNERIKLPKDVAEAIEELREKQSDVEIVFWSESYKIENRLIDKRLQVISEWTNKVGTDCLLSALVNGYTIEQTPEEKLAEYYSHWTVEYEKFRDTYDEEVKSEISARLKTIEITLEILGITIAGINDKEAE